MVPFEGLHKHDSDGNGSFYCAFQNYANTEVQKLPSQLRFSPPSIIITMTSNEPWNKETPKTDRKPSITNHKPWPFELVEVKFCFLRGPLRWLTTAKNSNVSYLLNFRIRVFLKSSVRRNKFNKQQLCAITALSLLAPHVYDRCLETHNLSCTEEAKPEEAKHKLKTTNFSSFEFAQVIDKSNLDRGIQNSPTLKRMSELELINIKDQRNR